MPSRLVALFLLLGVPALAGAAECPEWERLSAEQKSAEVERMIEGHLNSNVGRKYTSENPAAMRRCLDAFAPQISDDFDGACAQGKRQGMDALDQIFDRYFLSCVQ